MRWKYGCRFGLFCDEYRVRMDMKVGLEIEEGEGTAWKMARKVSRMGGRIREGKSCCGRRWSDLNPDDI